MNPSNQQRDEIVSTVAHELKALLSALVMRAERIGSDNPDLEMLRGLRELVVKHSWSMVRLIDNLVDVTKIDAQALRIEPRTIDMVGIVRETIERVGPTCRDHVLTLIATGAFECYVDTPRIEHVLTNYVTNAAKYSSKGTTIGVLVEGFDAHVRISVRDEGIGIEPEALPHVFERCYRADSGQQHAPGSGLGLYVSRHFIELHGGTVGVESTPGRGSTFWFTLPAAKQGTAPTAPPPR